MDTKKCRTCKQNKSNDEFGYKMKCGVSTGVVYATCIPCRARETERTNTEEAKQKRKEYNQQNAERKNAKTKEWREKNKTHIQNYSQHYHETNKEERLTYNKEYAQKNKDKIAETKKKHYEKNKETINKRKKEYRENNKEKVHEQYKQQWQKRKGLRKTDWDTILTHKLSTLKNIDDKKGREFNISKEYVNQLMQNANNKCNWCQCECKLTNYENRDLQQWSVDRIDNSLGHVEGNIVLSCLRCNYKRWHS